MKISIELSEEEINRLRKVARYREGDKDVDFVSRIICRLADAVKSVSAVEPGKDAK